MNWTLELTHPYRLFALLLLCVVAWGYRQSLLDFSRWQRRLSMAVRCVIIVLLVLSLAGLTLLHPTRDSILVFLVDQSRSVGPEGERFARDFIEKTQALAGDTPTVFIPFAESPEKSVTSLAPAPNASDDADDSIGEDEKTTDIPLFDTSSFTSDESWDEATDISAVFEPALASVPPCYVPRFVLLSDGNETSGDALSSALRAGVPISTVPLPAPESSEVQLAEVRLPSSARQGEPFFAEVVIQSTRETDAVVTVYRGGHKSVEETKSLEAGENVFRFQQTVTDQRQVEFSATVEAQEDTIYDNNTASGLLFVGGQPRALLIESDPRTARDFVWAMRQQEITVEARPPEGMPTSLDELENFETVILSNVPATALSMRQMDVLRAYVRDLGGGLIMLGGEQSFGLGGYYKTPVEEILPVRSNFEKEKEHPSLAIALVIDKSGSMGGEKIELAKTAARSAVELLSDRDFVSVIAFDGQSFIVCPMQSATSSGSIDGAIATIAAGGGTSIYPAMSDAYDELHRASAKIKHVILLTDGHSEPGDFTGMAQQMASAGITVSTVGVGSGADQALLQTIAETGNGRFYSCDDPQAIPQIFAKETMTASKSAIHEMPFLPVEIAATDVLSGVDLDTAPPLLGFVVTRAKPTSQFILSTETGEPLLVWWRYGLGMSVAFTSDVKSRWAAEWITWPGFAKFWAQVIRHTMRPQSSRGTQIEVVHEDGRAHVTVDAVDDNGNYLSEALGELTLIQPDLSKESSPLVATAPGRYEAEIPLGTQGGHHLQVSLDSARQQLTRQSRGVVVGYPDELRIRPANRTLLQRIAESTNGRFDPTPEEIMADDGRIAYQPSPLWPWLLTVAAFLFLLDVLLRRVDLARRNVRAG